MVTSTNIYVVKRTQDQGKVCRRCSKKILPGEVIVSKRTGHAQRRKYYHKPCYDELWLDL